MFEKVEPVVTPKTYFKKHNISFCSLTKIKTKHKYIDYFFMNQLFDIAA